MQNIFIAQMKPLPVHGENIQYSAFRIPHSTRPNSFFI